VHLVVPYTPGTGADIIARLLGPKLGERWNVAVPTENKPGATGNIGTEFVAKSAPDGYTLLFVATSFGTTPALARLPFDQRTALILREVDGLRYDEIAFSLGVAVGTVKSRLTRARQALRAELLGLHA